MYDLNKEKLKFEYMEKVANECFEKIVQLVKTLHFHHYLNVNPQEITLNNYNIYSILFYYMIRLHLFDSNKYSSIQIKEINEFYFTLIEKYHTYLMKKSFSEDYSPASIQSFFKIFDDFCNYCDTIFNSSDKTLLSYISTPCMLVHYLIKNNTYSINVSTNFVPEDDDFQILIGAVIKIITETDFYKKIDNITMEYLRKVKDI